MYVRPLDKVGRFKAFFTNKAATDPRSVSLCKCMSVGYAKSTNHVCIVHKTIFCTFILRNWVYKKGIYMHTG